MRNSFFFEQQSRNNQPKIHLTEDMASQTKWKSRHAQNVNVASSNLAEAIFTYVVRKDCMNWITCKDRLPENGVAVDTKIDGDGKGCRNEQVLKRQNNLWFFEDGSMYVYYTPTHWRIRENSQK